jgi:hypothetical protein
VDALAALGAGGYIGREDAANMTASYEFLRLLEHRLQLQRLRRTHLLPAFDDEEALRWLARAAHVRPDGTRDSLGVLLEEIKRQNLRVSRLHAKLFYQPLLESVGSEVGFAAGMSADAAERQLAALGYESPQSALTHLGALVNQSGRRGRVQSVLLPRLLDWLSDTPDPDSGLLAYRRISEALSDQRWYLATLRDESSVAKRLMRVLGTSAYVPELLMRAPEVIAQYADGPAGPKLLDVDPDGVSRALIASAGRHPDAVRAIAAARTLRRRELARVASADLLGLLDVRQVCTALTSVWAAVLECALEAVIRAAVEADGPAPARIAAVPVRAGQVVEPGQVLLQLEAPDLAFRARANTVRIERVQGELARIPARAVTIDRLLAAEVGMKKGVEAALLEWDVERLYRAIDDRRPQAQGGKRDGPRAASVRALGGHDQSDLKPGAEAQEAPEEGADQAREWSERIARAHANDGRFSMLRTLIADLPTTHTPWEQVLRTQLARSLAPKRDISWSRPSRSRSSM